MAGPITVCGLGPGSVHFLTQGALAALRSGAPVFLRTSRHPAARILQDLGIPVAGTFDGELAAPSHAAAEAAIATRLLAQAEQGPVVYAVPGHPLVGEEAVRLVLDQAPARGVAVELAGGPSFLDALLLLLRLDPAQGLEVLDGRDLDRRPPAGDLPAVIANVAVDQVHRSLAGRYPPDHPVTVVRAAGVPGATRTAVVPLAQLPAVEWADALTSLYLPPVAPRAPRRHPLDPLVDVMVRLRGPDGCPWDREQTHLSLRRYMLEEAYEAVEAMTAGDPRRLCEELGDVLLQVVFHAQLARERGDFTIDDVVEGITAKLIRRHPHVFGDVQVSGAADVVRNWQAIKAAEKGEQAPRSLLADVDRAQPALTQAAAVQKKAAAVGFDWPDAAGALDKVAEEVAEVRAALAAGDPGWVEQEVGDLLFAAVNVARLAGTDPEVALSGAVAKFRNRFARMEALARARGQDLATLSLAEMDRLWEEAKGAEK